MMIREIIKRFCKCSVFSVMFRCRRGKRLVLSPFRILTPYDSCERIERTVEGERNKETQLRGDSAKGKQEKASASKLSTIHFYTKLAFLFIIAVSQQLLATEIPCVL